MSNISKDLNADQVLVEKNNDQALVNRVNYQAKYIKNVDEFIGKIIDKTVVPIQLEIQPGRESGKKLCWMSCPYCYGGSADNTGTRLDIDKYLSVLDETVNGPHGNIKKIIVAGYATDPLHYEHVSPLIKKIISNKQIMGIHTKLLKIPKDLDNIVKEGDLQKGSYLTISLDAGFPDSYNKTHGLPGSKNVLSKIIENIKIMKSLKINNLNIGATYLVTSANNSDEEIRESIKICNEIGVETLRFSMPQTPRGYTLTEEEDIIIKEKTKEIERIANIVSETKSENCVVSAVDPDKDFKIDKTRYLPCFARFVHPAIGFDGQLYHCSESSSPNFSSMSLGNLQKRGFWESYYDYDLEKIKDAFSEMEKNACMCDRKLFIVNQNITESKNFNLLKSHLKI
jgi:MoaA/NifB/PqqE/SkfB family radical SAM enzyme